MYHNYVLRKLVYLCIRKHRKDSRVQEQEFFFYQGECIAGLLILDNHVTIVIHIKHVRYIINRSLIFGW
jgi:hypothetical protein